MMAMRAEVGNEVRRMFGILAPSVLIANDSYVYLIQHMLRVLLLLAWYWHLVAVETVPAEALAAQAKALRSAGSDVTALQVAERSFSAQWPSIEDAWRARDKRTYADIEEAMGDLAYHLAPDSLDLPAAQTAAARLAKLIDPTPLATTTTPDAPQADPAPTAPSPTPGTPAARTTVQTLGEWHALILQAKSELTDQPQAALTTLTLARRTWPDVEGAVKTRDAAAYRTIETELARASAQLQRQDPAAATTLAGLATTVAPFLQRSAYGWMDACLILLREGIEALFVIAALLAFLGRSGHAGQRRIIWWGAAAGVAASLGLAVLIHLVFRAAFSGADRELVEGIVGLAAAGLLFWVSWWLHRAASLSRWNNYIAMQTSAALASGSAVTLGLLSFLAVLREGAETALFYLGMAPSIATQDLVLGIAVGVVSLAIAGVVILRLGARLPVRPFFTVLGILLLVMGLKFIGAGVHALQIALIVPTTTIAGLPTIDLLGLYPTWETLLPQGAIATLLAYVWWRGRSPATPEPQAAAT
jgi:high-affinity iron transporter